MPSGELEGTTLKLTTGREVTDGHSHFPTDNSDTDEEMTDGTIVPGTQLISHNRLNERTLPRSNSL